MFQKYSVIFVNVRKIVRPFRQSSFMFGKSRAASASFENVPKIFCNLCKCSENSPTFSAIFENVRKIVGTLRKSSFMFGKKSGRFRKHVKYSEINCSENSPAYSGIFENVWKIVGTFRLSSEMVWKIVRNFQGCSECSEKSRQSSWLRYEIDLIHCEINYLNNK